MSIFEFKEMPNLNSIAWVYIATSYLISSFAAVFIDWWRNPG